MRAFTLNSESSEEFTSMNAFSSSYYYYLQLKKPSHPTRGVPTAINCLATLLKEPVVRSTFVQLDGIKLLVPLISPASTQQSIQVSLLGSIFEKLNNCIYPQLAHLISANRWLGKCDSSGYNCYAYWSNSLY